MKIGVLTYHCQPNFGAQLQIISTVGYLKKNNYDVVVLHWYPIDLEQMYSQRIPSYQLSCHENFTKMVLPITKIIRTEEELVDTVDNLNLNAIIIGSDALFKYTPLRKRRHFSLRKFRYIQHNVLSVEKLHGNPFFGGFVNKLKNKIPIGAFSVSSQNAFYKAMKNKEINEMNNVLKNFHYITVRDEWTRNMVSFILGNDDIKITPDPVFAFNHNCYLKLPNTSMINEKFNLSTKYVLLSFSNKYISDEYVQKLVKCLKDNGFEPVALPMPEGLRDYGVLKTISLPLNPLEWYSLIINSCGYIGERMHPIVVCLHNSIPFFAFDEYGINKNFMFKFKGKYLKTSSKTYLVVKQAGFENNLFSYKENKSLPSPGFVINRIKKFDKKKCNDFALKYFEEYNNAMQMLLSQII